MARTLFTILNDSNPTQVTTATITMSQAQIFGFSGFNPTNGQPLNNTGTVYVGFKSGELPIAVTSGSNVTLNFTSDRGEDGESLSNLWVKSSSGNAVYIIFS